MARTPSKPAPRKAAAATPAKPTVRGRSADQRAPGRPTGASPDQRARLLDAAVACFARRGIAAATLREIATDAGVNPALVHYYFGDNVQLQQAVIAERLMPAFAEVGKATLQSGDDI